MSCPLVKKADNIFRQVNGEIDLSRSTARHSAVHRILQPDLTTAQPLLRRQNAMCILMRLCTCEFLDEQMKGPTFRQRQMTITQKGVSEISTFSFSRFLHFSSFSPGPRSCMSDRDGKYSLLCLRAPSQKSREPCTASPLTRASRWSVSAID
jgi:hypothetical protein